MEERIVFIVKALLWVFAKYLQACLCNGFQFISSLKSNSNKDICVQSFFSRHALLVHLFNLVMNETFVQLLSFDSCLITNTLD